MLRRDLPLVIVLAICTCAPSIAQDTPKPETTDTAALLRLVAAELRQLRRELLADRIERQEERVQRLERDLQRARFELQSDDEVQRVQAQEILQLDQTLADPGLSPEERSQLEATRVAASSEDQSYRASLGSRVTEIGDLLQSERRRLASLRTAARTLSIPGPR